MYQPLQTRLQQELDAIKADGLYKAERPISSAQGPVIKTTDGAELLNFCANNYLGLSNHPRVIQAAKNAMNIPIPASRRVMSSAKK